MALLGLAEIGGVKLAYVRLETARQTLDLVQHETNSGIVLLDANAREGWAKLRQGSEEFFLRVAGGSGSVEVKPPANGQITTAERIGGLRAYIKTLPAEEREPFQAELNRFHATTATNDSVVANEAAASAPQNSLDQNSAPDNSIAAAETSSLDADQTRQLNDLLATLAPPPGSRQGTGDEIAQLRRLRIAQNDPAVRARILNELRAYAAPAN